MTMKKYAVWLKWNNVSATPTSYLRVLVKPGITFWLKKLGTRSYYYSQGLCLQLQHSVLTHKYLQPVRLVLDKSSRSDPTSVHQPMPPALNCMQLPCNADSSSFCIGTAINPWTGTEKLYLKSLNFSYFLKGC